MKEKLNLEFKQRENLTEILSKEGLLVENIEDIFNSNYQTFFTSEDIESSLSLPFDNSKYMNIIQGIADGYSLEEMSEALGIHPSRIDSFKEILSQNKLSPDLLKAFNTYTIDSNIILGAKRGVSKSILFENIQNEFCSRMLEYGFSKEKIEQIISVIKGLDYTKPVHENYSFIQSYLEQQAILKKYVATIQSFVRNLDLFFHLEEVLNCLDFGLSAYLEEPIKLFRAVKSSFLKKYLSPNQTPIDLVGCKIEDIGYSSTSPIYDSSFAKYDDYEVVFEIYAPKGTEGVFVTSFSSYGSTEQEFLLNSNDLYVVDVNPNFIDQNGRKKIICKSLVISKEKSSYKEIFEEKKRNNYRQKINSLLDLNEQFLQSEFFIYETELGQKRCHHSLYSIQKDNSRKILLENDFEFRKDLLQTCLFDFAKKSPINDTHLKCNTNQTDEKTRSDVRFWNEENGMMSICNIDISFAIELQRMVSEMEISDSKKKF